MAEFYKGNNRKMMTHDSFSTSHEEILYMEKLPAIPNSVSYVGETKSKVSAAGKNQLLTVNFSLLTALSLVFCLLVGGTAWGQDNNRFSNKDCYYNQDLEDPTTSWQTYEDYIFGYEYCRCDVYLESGRKYIFSLCSSDGASVEFDSYIGLYGYGYGCFGNPDDGVLNGLAGNDDACGTASRIEYTATQSEWTSLYITGYWNDDNCNGNDCGEGNFTLKYKYEASSPSCPTTISSHDDWTAFCNCVNNGHSYAGETVTLAADVSGIARMVGTSSSHPFKGTFDGGGHTLTVAITGDGTQGQAPFQYIKKSCGKRYCNCNCIPRGRSCGFCFG